MKRQNLSLAVLLAAGMAVALPGKYLLGSTAAAQTPRALPTFEMEKDWPKVPPQWKVGDVSSFTTDAQGNVWLIHRPRTLKGEDLKKASPPQALTKLPLTSNAITGEPPSPGRRAGLWR